MLGGVRPRGFARKRETQGRRSLFHGQLGNRLADVAVVVDDLRDGEPAREQVGAVAGRGGADRIGRGRCFGHLPSKRLRQLGLKDRDAMPQLVNGGTRPGARRQLPPASG